MGSMVWQKLQEGWYKVNSDTTFFKDHNIMGFFSLSWLKNKGLSKCSFEFDAKGVVGSLNSCSQDMMLQALVED